jgi:hypothetical protein
MKISATNRSKKLCSSRYYSLKYYSCEHYFQKASTLFVLALFTDKNVFALQKFNHSTSTLEHALIFLKYMVIKHVFTNLVSLSKRSNPH